MSGFHPFDLVDPLFPPFSYLESSISTFSSPSSPFVEELCHRHHYLGFALDLLNPAPFPSFDLSPKCIFPSSAIAPLDLVPVADPFGLERSAVASFKRFREQAETELCLRDLSDRVAALELGLGRSRSRDLDRKFTWTAEINGPKELGLARKYKWTTSAKASGERAAKCTAEIKGAEEEEGFDRKFVWAADTKGVGEKNLKWTAEFKGKGKHSPLSRTYTWAASTKPREEKTVSKEEKANKEKKKGEKEKEGTVHVVEIEEKNPGATAIRKAFYKRCERGKRKELSPVDAALLIQMTFRAHLARRSQVLRCLRELAVAKARLKDIRASFYNFSYRRHVANNAEERQRFSEKIIVLLLTVEAIEGPDYMVRAAKKSMVEELEAMLEVIDPQPASKLGSMRRRKFDLPDGVLSKEMMEGVAEVVQMLDEE
ncbi:BAG family molecular chaperone regulator 7-like [Canna indica]|uniref:BAG family molecular chaperone regulator 7-like n=1 Tax=Canna indica TaxID=4628 RepID=A0AAQ3Q5Y7_9LILI|nr:BAG family molecular chaperone regulator 7-like [Canna indica]